MTGFALLSLILASPPVFDVSVGVGGDSNPYELPSDPALAGSDVESRSGALLGVDARAEWQMWDGDAFRLSAEGDFEALVFGFVSKDSSAARPARASDLNRHSGGVSLPLQLASISPTRTVSLEATLEPFASMNRETYLSQRTGRPMVIDVDPHPDDVVRVNLGDRYDTDEWGARLDLDAELGRMVDLSLGARLTTVDYVEDYDEIEAVDSWDHRESRGQADVVFRPGNWTFATGYTLRILDYRERFPRDSAGEKLLPEDPGYSPQKFTYHHATAKVGLSTGIGRATVRWRGTRRLDMHEGYVDYTEHKIAGDVRIDFPHELELRFRPSYSVRTYDSLRVRYDPSEPVTNRRRLSVETQAEWPAGSRYLRMFVSGSVVSQESENALYSYVEARAMTGFRVRVR